MTSATTRTQSDAMQRLIRTNVSAAGEPASPRPHSWNDFTYLTVVLSELVHLKSRDRRDRKRSQTDVQTQAELPNKPTQLQAQSTCSQAATDTPSCFDTATEQWKVLDEKKIRGVLTFCPSGRCCWRSHCSLGNVSWRRALKNKEWKNGNP